MDDADRVMHKSVGHSA